MNSTHYILVVFLMFISAGCSKEEQLVLDFQKQQLEDSIIGKWSFEHQVNCFTSAGDTSVRSDFFWDTTWFERDFFRVASNDVVNEWFVEEHRRKLIILIPEEDPFFTFITAGEYFFMNIHYLSDEEIVLKEMLYNSFIEDSLAVPCIRNVRMQRLE
jgi:hypothetical protein